MSIRAFIFAAMMTGVSAAAPVHAEPASDVVLRSDVVCEPLNPARGDASPKAGVLWGDMRKDVPTGAIIEFADGFSSPPHIHNITYRAVVIEGAVHNDDPTAESMWMGPGSFWTQPAGEAHITAARDGGSATAFLEILEGPYLVQPTEEQFDNGEHPINLDAGNIVWLAASDVTWIDHPDTDDASGAQMAFLWGQLKTGEMNGTFLKLPAGFDGELISNDSQLRAVLVSGAATYELADTGDAKALTPGSYFGSKEKVRHHLKADANQDSVFYVRTEGKYELRAN
ncbi:MAG: DUF4437 domain-containing protein [Rhodospirillales bacterium]|nr:DUF4437 domain-containing protein [Rhodospirillales bacterium]